jgi:hypothetical protein
MHDESVSTMPEQLREILKGEDEAKALSREIRQAKKKNADLKPKRSTPAVIDVEAVVVEDGSASVPHVALGSTQRDEGDPQHGGALNSYGDSAVGA